MMIIEETKALILQKTNEALLLNFLYFDDLLYLT